MLVLNRICYLLMLVAMAGCSESVKIEPTRMTSPASQHSAQPHLDQTPEGLVVLSWIESETTEYVMKTATLSGHQWAEPRTVTQGNNWFVNWADFPSVTPVSESRWAAHWLVKSSSKNYSYDVAVAFTEDAGQTWGEALSPHTDETLTEHGFVSLYPWQERIGAVWLDGRNTGGGHSDHNHAEGGGGMTLRGAEITPDGTLSQEQLIDDFVCDCCQTDTALTTAGPVMVYRNRTQDEIRDIYIARAVDGIWSEGAPVANDNWQVNGCPVNGPAIAATGNRVGVVWFTSANEQPKVRFARSGDGGMNFEPPIDIDDQATGRVDIAALEDASMVISWVRRIDGEQAEIVAAKIKPDNTLGQMVQVAQTDVSRPSGFPQMIRSGENLVFAWTEVSEAGSRVQTAKLAVRDLP